MAQISPLKPTIQVIRPLQQIILNNKDFRALYKKDAYSKIFLKCFCLSIPQEAVTLKRLKGLRPCNPPQAS